MRPSGAWDTRDVLVRTTAAVMAAMSVVALAEGALPQPDSERHCQPATDAQRRVWQTRAPVREQPTLADGTRVRHWPTATLGAWVVELSGPGRSELARVTSAAITRVVFDERCHPATRVERREAAGGPRFSDHDLAGLVRSGRRGVVHLWSPHMPLSVDAIEPLTTAARARGLTVDLVLDPAADPAFAARVVRERGLPEAALRVADSVELRFRDALVHAPSVLVYDGGAIAGSVYPGGHTVEEYAAHFARVLTRGR